MLYHATLNSLKMAYSPDRLCSKTFVSTAFTLFIVNASPWMVVYRVGRKKGVRRSWSTGFAVLPCHPDAVFGPVGRAQGQHRFQPVCWPGLGRTWPDFQSTKCKTIIRRK